MRRVLSLFLILFSVEVLGQTEPIEVNEKNALARPLLIVPPAFPKDAPAGKPSVRIRMKGAIDTKGQFVSPEFDHDEGEQGFVAAIKEVLEFWRFRPAIDRAICKTRASEGVVLVWFEMKDGEPSVSVSMPATTKPVATQGSLSGRQRVHLRKPKPEFPRSARIIGAEGAAEVVMMVNREGEIVDANLVYSIPFDDFGTSAIRGLRFAQFKADDSPEAAKPTCISQAFNFCLVGGASISHPMCK